MAGNKQSGFASMPKARHLALSSKGGGKGGHRFNSKTGAAAGTKGGHLSRGGQGRHADTSKPTHPRAK